MYFKFAAHENGCNKLSISAFAVWSVAKSRAKLFDFSFRNVRICFNLEGKTHFSMFVHFWYVGSFTLNWIFLQQNFKNKTEKTQCFSKNHIFSLYSFCNTIFFWLRLISRVKTKTVSVDSFEVKKEHDVAYMLKTFNHFKATVTIKLFVFLIAIDIAKLFSKKELKKLWIKWQFRIICDLFLHFCVPWYEFNSIRWINIGGSYLYLLV